MSDQETRKRRLPFGQLRKENYRHGYPFYSALVGHQPEFQNFRRFKDLRMRLLLIKQDRICQLEKKLNEIDAAEESDLFLGSSRLDRNAQRQELFQELDTALSAYDDFLQRTHWVMSRPYPAFTHIETMRIWLESTNNISRLERAYLDADEDWDLLNIGLVEDGSMPKFAAAMENTIGYLCFWVLPNSITQNTDLINITRPVVKAFARALTVSFALILLLVPIIALNAVQSTTIRFVIIFIATALFVSLITVASKARFVEVFATGAAYAAVLVVFVAGNSV